MPCDQWRRNKQQTLRERIIEVDEVVKKLSANLAAGSVKAKVGPQGGIAFVGLSDEDRAGVTDVCAYRRLMVSGSALARAQVARAEQMAGRSVDRKVLAVGVHSHDGGATWHDHKG